MSARQSPRSGCSGRASCTVDRQPSVRAAAARQAASTWSRRSVALRRRRAATPARRALARASRPTWLSKGPAPVTAAVKLRVAPERQRRQGAVGQGHEDGAPICRPTRRVEHRPVVSGQVDHHDHVGRADVGQQPGYPHLRAADRDDTRPEHGQLGGEQAPPHRTRRRPRARKPGHSPAGGPLGQQQYWLGRKRPPVDAFEGGRDVGHLGGQGRAEYITGCRVADPLRGGAQAAGHLFANGRLEFDEAVEAQFGGQADHGGAAGAGPAGHVGHRPEGHRLGVVGHHRRHPPLGRGQGGQVCVDLRRNSHGIDVTVTVLLK